MSEQPQLQPQTIMDGGLRIHAEPNSNIDFFGTVFLGLGFLILLSGYMRAQGRIRRLTEKLAKLEAAQ